MTEALHYEDHIWHLKRTVVAAGARWVGLQQGFSADGEHNLVLFQSELSNSTLALPDDAFFTINAVQEKIQQSDKQFENKPVKIPRHVIRDLVQRLNFIAETLNKYTEEK